MEKALEILKSPIVEFGTDNDLNLQSNAVILFATREQIQEAIAELEEAQLTRIEWYQKGYNEAMKFKTCHWCKQSWEPNNQTFHKYFCSYLRIPVHGNFYCNRYEAKDTQC